jgi:hypothetical protein
MLDFDLAELYEVETRVLKQAVKRNIDRFPSDFMFELSKIEWLELITICDKLKTGIKFSPKQPMAFTEHGVTMLSSVLKSNRAIDVNIQIIRAFIELKKLILFESQLTVQLKQLVAKYDQQFDDIFETINYLLKKDNLERQTKERRKIGYKKEQ